MTASKGRVLVVEDSPMQRELVAGLLRDEGYDVAEAADGRAGVELAARHQPEVIFSDIQMPEMTGIEMCRALKKSEATREIPVVFLSSLDNLDDVVRGVEAGACDYLSKSADSDDKILAVLADQLARRRDTGAPRVHAAPTPRDLPVSYFEKSHMGLVVSDLARQPLYMNPAGRRAVAGDGGSPIDAARFGPSAGHPLLGAADYKLVHHAKNGRSVYSFCMCPGGTVVAATSEAGRVVTNGMSQYSRNERNANAGIVVGVAPDDYRQRPGDGSVDPLDGVAFQRTWESRAFELGGGGYVAPGQMLGDFVRRQASSAFGAVLPSYTPGVRPTDLAAPGRESQPGYPHDAIREAMPAFERQIKGFAMADAVLTGVETRTSSPLRIPRGPDRQSVNVAGLYPAGEGAGYAGGIMSAGVDGIEVAESVARHLLAAAAPR